MAALAPVSGRCPESCLAAITSIVLVLAAIVFAGVGALSLANMVSDVQAILGVAGLGFAFTFFGLAVLIGNLPPRG